MGKGRFRRRPFRSVDAEPTGTLDKSAAGARSVGDDEPHLGTQMLHMPSCMADRVNAVNDLKVPEVAAVFANDGIG